MGACTSEGCPYRLTGSHTDVTKLMTLELSGAELEDAVALLTSGRPNTATLTFELVSTSTPELKGSTLTLTVRSGGGRLELR